MSDRPYITDDPTPEQLEDQLAEQEAAIGGSLRDRMRARRQQIESRIAEKFELPGYEGVVAVELSKLSWETGRKIAAKHRKMRDPAMVELYTACDQLLRATEGFYEVVEKDEGVSYFAQEGETWTSLARQVVDRQLPEDLTPRQAIIALLGDLRVIGLWTQWGEWMSGYDDEVQDEVAQDFGSRA